MLSFKPTFSLISFMLIKKLFSFSSISAIKVALSECNSDDHYIYYCGQESLRRNEVALIVNKRVWNAVLGCNRKNDRMISVHFQDKPFNITLNQVHAPTTNARSWSWMVLRSIRPSQSVSSVAQLFLTLCDLMDCSMPGFSSSILVWERSTTKLYIVTLHI